MSLKSTPDHIVISLNDNLDRMQREKEAHERADTGHTYHIEYASMKGTWVLYKRSKKGELNQ